MLIVEFIFLLITQPVVEEVVWVRTKVLQTWQELLRWATWDQETHLWMGKASLKWCFRTKTRELQRTESQVRRDTKIIMSAHRIQRRLSWPQGQITTWNSSKMAIHISTQAQIWLMPFQVSSRIIYIRRTSVTRSILSVTTTKIIRWFTELAPPVASSRSNTPRALEITISR